MSVNRYEFRIDYSSHIALRSYIAERATMFGLWHSSGNTLLDSSHNVLFVRPLAFRRILQRVAYSMQYVRISHDASVHFKNNHLGHYRKLQRNI